MKLILRALLCLGLVVGVAAAQAQTIEDASEYVGYTILGVFTITGYQEEDGTMKDSFEGCNFGRVIILDESKALTCTGYGYQYAYRPQAVILVRGSSFKMLVEGDSYDMRN